MGSAASSGLAPPGESRSIGSAFVVGGLATGLALPLLARVRATGGAPDRIVGSRGGVESPCAASGLPDVGTLETGVVS